MSENEARKFARKARKSIMAINNTNSSYKQMGLRNIKSTKASVPFKAGKIRYEPARYLSSAMTPPRTRQATKKSMSTGFLHKKEKDIETEFKLAPSTTGNI